MAYPPPRDFPGLEEELDDDRLADLAGLFKTLANENRLRMLQALHLRDEVSVTDLAEEVGASVQSVSNQLQRLVDQQIVAARRDGQRMCYRIVDPCVPGLMDLGICLLGQRTAPPTG